MNELVIVYSNSGKAYDVAKTYAEKAGAALHRIQPEIGRASCRERV